MFYAGNGNQLVAFNRKVERDIFCECHRNFIGENSNSARTYPQFGLVKNTPYCVMDDMGIIDNITYKVFGGK